MTFASAWENKVERLKLRLGRKVTRNTVLWRINQMHEDNVFQDGYVCVEAIRVSAGDAPQKRIVGTRFRLNCPTVQDELHSLEYLRYYLSSRLKKTSYMRLYLVVKEQNSVQQYQTGSGFGQFAAISNSTTQIDGITELEIQVIA